jgi:hypothetical protein
MTDSCSNLSFVIIGGLIGIAGSLLVEWVRRHFLKKDRGVYARKVLQAISKEIEEGISRCQGLSDLANRNTISYSRVYTDLFDSVKLRIPEDIEDIDTLRILHRIYYRFDLINFNMEHDRFDRGAGYAKEYIAEIKANYESLKTKIDP